MDHTWKRSFFLLVSITENMIYKYQGSGERLFSFCGIKGMKNLPCSIFGFAGSGDTYVRNAFRSLPSQYANSNILPIFIYPQKPKPFSVSHTYHSNRKQTIQEKGKDVMRKQWIIIGIAAALSLGGWDGNQKAVTVTADETAGEMGISQEETVAVEYVSDEDWDIIVAMRKIIMENYPIERKAPGLTMGI